MKQKEFTELGSTKLPPRSIDRIVPIWHKILEADLKAQ